MIDWWQALLLSVAGALVGGLTTLAVSYATHSWTTDAAREAEERASERRLAEEERGAARRKEAEEREATRQWRRERVKPLQDFIEVAKRHDATSFLKKSTEHAWEQNVLGIQDKLTLEDLRKAIAKDARFAGPDFNDLARAYGVAFITAPTLQMGTQLAQFWGGLAPERKTKEDRAKHLAALGVLEQLVEDYVTKV
jgi:hypothetical protein